jgi:hypothetical protein
MRLFKSSSSQSTESCPASKHQNTFQTHIYSINRISEGIVLISGDCGHFEHVSQFDLRIGSQRTQAAKAMEMHSLVVHNTPQLKPVPKNYGVMERW